MLRHALGAALPSQAKHLAKASFGILKLPLLPDRLAFSSRRAVRRVCACRPHRGCFLTTLVRFYRTWHTGFVLAPPVMRTHAVSSTPNASRKASSPKGTPGTSCARTCWRRPLRSFLTGRAPNEFGFTLSATRSPLPLRYICLPFSRLPSHPIARRRHPCYSRARL